MLFLKLYGYISYLFFILIIKGGYFLIPLKIITRNILKIIYQMFFIFKFIFVLFLNTIIYGFKFVIGIFYHKSKNKKIIIPDPPNPKRNKKYFKFKYFFMLLIAPFFIYFIVFYFILNGEVNLENQKLLIKLHQYRTAIAVRDEHKNLLGIMRNTQRPPSEFIDVNENTKYSRSFNRESSLYVDKVPDFFWKVLIEREHKKLIFEDEKGIIGYIKGVINGSYKGVDISAPLRKGLNEILTGNSGGGSTLMNIIIKNLYGGSSYFSIERNRKFECPYFINLFDTSCRKWVEYHAARDLFPLLAKNNGKEFKRWVAMHAHFIGGVGGSQNSLYGLQAASAVMFGNKPEKLNMAQQSFLATSFLLDFRFSTLSEETIHSEQEWKKVCAKEPNKWNRTERWECRKRVSRRFAEKVLHNTYKGKELSSKLRILNNEFERLMQPKKPKIPIVLQHFFDNDKDSKNKKIKKYANLHTRLDTFMSDFKILLKNSLHNFTKKYPNGHIVELIATLPLDIDMKFRKKIDAIFKELDAKFSFNKDFVKLDNKKNNASVRISVSNLEGNIIRYYLREGNNAIEEKLGLKKPLRPMASIAKIPLAALLVSKGVAKKEELCNEYYKGLKNAGGDIGVKDCSSKLTFLESLAQSKNLPLRYALGKKIKATEEELNKLFDDFKIKADLNANNINSTDHLIENLSFGRAMTSAAHTHEIINRIAQILIYNGNGVLFSISTIKNVNFVDYINRNPQMLTLSGNKKIDKLPNINHYFRTTSSIETMKDLLSAPINNPKGTLSFLKNINNGSVIFGKTGTFDTEEGNIKDKYVVGVLKVKNKYYTFSILIGSEPFKGEGLINKIKTKDLMKPIIQEIINSLNDENSYS